MFPWLTNLFASPALLWGIGLAGAPVLIHLLYRRRFRETSWAAMKFLLEAARKNSRRLRIEQILLLIVRTLLILLAFLAAAEPLARQAGMVFQSGAPVHRVIVIDGSASMAARAGETSTFAAARDLARNVVENSRPGDAFNLVRMSAIEPRLIVQKTEYNSSAVLAELDRLDVSPAPAALLTTLEEVLPLLKTAPEIRQKEVYLISDFQRATWDLGSGDATSRLSGLLKKINDTAELVVLEAGEPGSANVAITGVDLLEPILVANRPIRVRVNVRNLAATKMVEKDLQLLIDDKLVDRHLVTLDPGAEGIELFSPVIEEPGEHRLEARLGDDVLSLDNRRWMSLHVKDRLRILCVYGKGKTKGLAKSSDFLSLALSPNTGRSQGSTRESTVFEPAVVSESELADQDLSLFDAVFLCNVRRFSDRETAGLTAFMKQGGGVVFCVGDQVVAKEYNELLERNGGIMPAKLGERKGDPNTRESPIRFDPGEYAHPVLAAFQGNPDSGLESTISYAYLDASGIQEAGGRVALRFDNGAPAIIEKSIGLGRSILVTTSIDDQWSLWPLWPSYVPLIQELALFAVAGRGGPQSRLIGESLEAPLAITVGEAPISVVLPNGEKAQVRGMLGQGDARYIYGPAVELGIYEARVPPPTLRSDLFAVNLDPIESNLTRYAADELKAGPLRGIDASIGRRSQEAADSEQTQVMGPASGGLTRPILYSLLYLLFVEQALAWNFSRGLWLLCPPLALLLHWRRRS